MNPAGWSYTPGGITFLPPLSNMRTVLLKSIAGGFSLQEPGTRVGVSRGEFTYAVTDVPDSVQDGEVLALAEASGITGGYSVEFDRLGACRVGRAA